jgi:DNA repair protein RadC
MSSGSDASPMLYVRDSTVYRPATAQETLAAARKAISHQFRRSRVLNSPAIVREYLRITIAHLEHEVFCLVLLDGRHQLIAVRELFRGTINAAVVHPREVLKEALKYNAAFLILAHNHPSGIAEPSTADEIITQRIKDALALVDVGLLDHLVIGGNNIVSMAERGLV